MRRARNQSVTTLPSEITPEARYLSRRTLLAGAVGLAAVQTIGRFLRPALAETAASAPDALSFTRNTAFSVAETPNSLRDITTYNNYYEFGTDNRRIPPKTRNACAPGRGTSPSAARRK
jgi:hypothetical protein